MSATTLPPAVTLERERAPRSLWSDAWRRLRRNRAAIAAAAYLLVITALAFGAAWIPGLADPAAQDLKLGASPPSAAHATRCRACCTAGASRCSSGSSARS
jgi:oligopeptide transport system permease protein